jgi:hypothetical protein
VGRGGRRRRGPHAPGISLARAEDAPARGQRWGARRLSVDSEDADEPTGEARVVRKLVGKSRSRSKDLDAKNHPKNAQNTVEGDGINRWALCSKQLKKKKRRKNIQQDRNLKRGGSFGGFVDTRENSQGFWVAGRLGGERRKRGRWGYKDEGGGGDREKEGGKLLHAQGRSHKEERERRIY